MSFVRTKKITITDAAARMGVTPQTVRDRIKAGRLPGRMIGGRWLVEERVVTQEDSLDDRLTANEVARRLGRGTAAASVQPKLHRA